MKQPLTFYSIRLDKKQLLNQVRAMQDNYIEILIDTSNLKYISIKDRYNLNRITTKN